MNFSLRLSAAAFVITVGATSWAEEVPRQSIAIRSVMPDLNRVQKWDSMHGDTADPFWADDDHLYHFTCDGRGFGSQQRNFCFNRLDGPDLEHLVGTLVNSMDTYGKSDETGPDGATWKVSGQECIDGVFYAFVERNRYGHKSGDPQVRQTSFNTSLIASHDRGLTWTHSAKENYDAPMWPGARFGAPSFIHYGRNGGQVKWDRADEYVYALSNNGFWNNGDDVIVGRVRRADLARLNAGDWSYYRGGDGLREEAWTRDLHKARPVLTRPAKLGWTAPVFIPALNRYLMVSWYVTPVLKAWFEPDRVVYDFFEAGHPWGPWEYVSSFDDRFLAGGSHMYGPNLSAKYQIVKGDSLEVQLFTSGCPFEDYPTGLYKIWRIPLIVSTRPTEATAFVNDNDARVRYSGQWSYGSTRDYVSDGQLYDNEGDVHYTNHAGAAAEVSFRGTGVAVVCEKYKDLGELEIYIDGTSRGRVNLSTQNFPRLARVVVFRVDGLANATHTLRVVNAADSYVVLDGFSVVGESAAN
jgi:hypothetical protein